MPPAPTGLEELLDAIKRLLSTQPRHWPGLRPLTPRAAGLNYQASASISAYVPGMAFSKV